MILKYKLRQSEKQSVFTQSILLGLLLSDCGLTMRITSVDDKNNIAMFALVYFCLTTIFVIFLSVQCLKCNKTVLKQYLDIFEMLGIPFSIIILRKGFLQQEHDQQKIACFGLFVLQSGLIITKTGFLGSIAEELSSVSVVIRNIRILKICLLTCLPLFIQDIVIQSAIFLLTQSLSFFLFLQKFTFQRVLAEHHLMIGSICGLISSIDFCIFSVIDSRYTFVGEGLIIVFFLLSFLSLYPLYALIELKYSFLLKDKSKTRSDESFLVVCLFIRECLFEGYCSLRLSQNATSIALLEAIDIVKSSQNVCLISETRFREATTKQLFKQLAENRDLFCQRFVVSVYNRFKKTGDICCLEFLIDCSLRLKGYSASHSLIVYYDYYERKGYNSSALDLCRLSSLYNKIHRHIDCPDRDEQQIAFVKFSDRLISLRQRIEQSLNFEIDLIQYFLHQDEKDDIFPENKLLKRHQKKQKVRNAFLQCQESSLYLTSNQFKFLLLTFGTVIEKHPEALSLKLKRLFFQSKAVQIRLFGLSDCLVVLKGDGKGEMIRCNEEFKHNFGIGKQKQSRHTINDLFPSSRQRKRHTDLMIEASQSDCWESKNHEDYQCLLAVGRELAGINLKSIERYVIGTRLYHQCREGFNYVCQLRKNSQAQFTYSISQKQNVRLEQKGICVEQINRTKFTQLDEQMSIISFSLEICDLHLNKIQNGKIGKLAKQKYSEDKGQSYLLNKIKTIEKNLMKGQKEIKIGCCNWIQQIVVLSLVLFITTFMVFLSVNMTIFQDFILDDVDSLRKSFLINTRLLLDLQMLQIVNGTTSFPDDMCQSTGVPSLRNYIIATFLNDLTYGYEALINRATDGLMNYEVIKNVYDQNYTTDGLSWGSMTVTYMKFMNLLKTSFIEKVTNHQFQSINQTLYLYYMPSYYESISVRNLLQIYSPIQLQVSNNFKLLYESIQSFNVIFCLSTLAAVAFLSALRILGSKSLMKYYDAIAKIKEETFTQRYNELKKVKNSLKIARDCSLLIEICPRLGISFQANSQKGKSCQFPQLSDQRIEGQVAETGNEEQDSLLGRRCRRGSRDLPESMVMRLVLYSRCYLLLMLLVLLSVIASLFLCTMATDIRLSALQSFHDNSEEMMRIQQNYANLLAYNWLKTLSYQVNIPLASSAQNLQNSALGYFSTSAIESMMQRAYPQDFSHKILNGDVCEYFKNTTFCSQFKSGLYNYGFSFLLPTTIKEQKDAINFSTKYSDYFPLLCAHTKLLIEAVVPMTENIPIEGYKQTTSQINNQRPMAMAFLIAMLTILFVFLSVCQYINHQKLRIIREQTLSLDSVSNLYRDKALISYFNELYYQ